MTDLLQRPTGGTGPSRLIETSVIDLGKAIAGLDEALKSVQSTDFKILDKTQWDDHYLKVNKMQADLAMLTKVLKNLRVVLAERKVQHLRSKPSAPKTKSQVIPGILASEDLFKILYPPDVRLVINKKVYSSGKDGGLLQLAASNAQNSSVTAPPPTPEIQ